MSQWDEFINPKKTTRSQWGDFENGSDLVGNALKSLGGLTPNVKPMTTMEKIARVPSSLADAGAVGLENLVDNLKYAGVDGGFTYGQGQIAGVDAPNLAESLGLVSDDNLKRQRDFWGRVNTDGQAEVKRQANADVLNRKAELDINSPHFNNKYGQMVFNGAQSFAQQLPILAASIPTRSAAPMLAYGGASTGLDKNREAREAGYNSGEAALIGGAHGAIEVATEFLPGKHLVDDVLKGSGLTKTIMRQVLPDVVGENVAGLSQAAIDTQTGLGGASKGNWDDFTSNIGDTMASSTIGSLVGSGMFGGIGAGMSKLAGVNQEQPVQKPVFAPQPKQMMPKAQNRADALIGAISAARNQSPHKVSPHLSGHGWSPNVSPTLANNLANAAQKHGVDLRFMKALAFIESKGDSNAVSTTGARGIGQFTTGTGKQYGLIKDGQDLRSNEALNVDATARLAKDNARAIGSSEPYLLYMAHQQGAGGVAALLRASKNGDSADGVMVGNQSLRYNMDVNGGKGKTPSQFLAMWKDKYAKVHNAVNDGSMPTNTVSSMSDGINQDTSNDIFDNQNAINDQIDNARSNMEQQQAEAQDALEEQMQAMADAQSEAEHSMRKMSRAARAGLDGEVEVSGKYEPTQWQLMEADELDPTMEKSDNQLRDRTRVASELQVDGIANNLDFRKLGDSPMMDYGAPTLGMNGKIIGGNGRVAGITRAYSSGKADGYKTKLAENAGRFGFTPEDVAGMQKPVLVRRFKNFVDTTKAAIASNEGGGLVMSTLEQAKADGIRLPDLKNMQVNEDGNINTVANRDYIRAFIAQLPMNQQTAFADSQGQLSKQGVERLRNAVLYKAYGDTPQLQRMIESTDDGSRNIANALAQAAPRVADAKNDIAKGDIHNADISQDMVDAVGILEKIRADGGSLREYLAQRNMFGDDLSIEARQLLKFFNENINSAKKIRTFINAYYDALDAQGSPKQDDIFGDAASVDKPTLLNKVINEQSGQPYTDELGRKNRTSGQSDRGSDGAIEQPARLERPVGESAGQSEQRPESQGSTGSGFESGTGQPERLSQSTTTDIAGERPSEAAAEKKYTGDTIVVDGKVRPALNSDGKHIHETEDSLRNFWHWFGDSKVVDDKGRPLVVFHGTDKKFNVFNQSAESNFIYGDNNDSGGLFFTPSKSYAETYGSNLVETYLSIQNLKSTSIDQTKLSNQVSRLNELKNAGFDGVLNDDIEYVVFNPNQIKSANNNVGEFGRNNNDIRFSRSKTETSNTPKQIIAVISEKMNFKDGDFATRLPHVNIVDNADSLNIPSDAQAYFDKRSNSVTLIANRIEAGNEFGVFLHEVFHANGESMLGDKMPALSKFVQRFKDRPADSIERQVFDAAHARAEASGNYNGELVAYAIEEAVNRGVDINTTSGTGAINTFLRHVLKAFTDAMKKLVPSFKGQFTAQDLVAIARGAANLEIDSNKTDNAHSESSTVDDKVAASIRSQGERKDAFSPISGEIAKYQEELDRLLAGSVMDATATVGMTPPVLQFVGAQYLPIKISRATIDKAMGKVAGKQDDSHTVRFADIKNLPELLANPIMVLKSKTQGDKSVVVVIEATTKTGLPVIVPMRLNYAQYNKGNYFNVNSLSSAYGRSNAGAYVTNAIKNGDVLYYNKQKGDLFIDGLGLQLLTSRLNKSLASSVPNENEIRKRFDAGLLFSKRNDTGPSTHEQKIADKKLQEFVGDHFTDTPKESITAVEKDYKDGKFFDRNGELKIGKAAFDKVSEIARSKYSPLQIAKLVNNQSPEFKKMWNDFVAERGLASHNAMNIAQAGTAFEQFERDLIGDVLTKELAAGVNPPAEVVKIAGEIRTMLDEQTNSLTELGMISKDSAERWKDTYLPRFYNKQADLFGGVKQFVQTFGQLKIAAKAGMDGSHMKGRGIFKQVEKGRESDYEKLGYELRGHDKDQNPIMWRDYTKEERADMGEIKDGIMRFTAGYMQTQADIAKARLYHSIANNRELSTNEQMNDGWVQVPNTEIVGTGVKKYGDLGGMYVHPEVFEKLNAEFGLKEANEFFSVYKKALGYWKICKTVYNPVAHVNNVMSNLSIIFMSGGKYRDVYKSVMDLKNKTGYYDEALKCGLIGDGVDTSMLREMFNGMGNVGSDNDAIKLLAGNAAGFAEGKLGKTVDLLKALKNFAQKAYGAEDAVFKLSTFRTARERGLSIDDAREYANTLFFDYSDVPVGVRRLRDFGVLPFVSYTAKAVPMMARLALTRPHRMLAFVGVMHALNALSYMMLGAGGDEDDEEKNKPEYLKGFSLYGVPKMLRLPWNEDNGNAAFLDIARWLPLGDFADVNNQKGGLPIPQWMMPSSPVSNLYDVAVMNKDSFTGDDFTKSYQSTGEKSKIWGKWFAQQWLPSSVGVPFSYHTSNVMDGLKNQFEGTALADALEIMGATGERRNGKDISLSQAALGAVGIKLRTFNPSEEAAKKSRKDIYEAREIKADIARIRKDRSITDTAKSEKILNRQESLARLFKKPDGEVE